jgi:uncharacterized protein
VYTKPKGKLPDYTQPVVLRANKCTVEDFVSQPNTTPCLFSTSAKTDECNAIHKTIVEQFRQAIVYGKSVKHQPQRVGLSHELADEDISRFPERPHVYVLLDAYYDPVTIIKR